MAPRVAQLQAELRHDFRFAAPWNWIPSLITLLLKKWAPWECPGTLHMPLTQPVCTRPVSFFWTEYNNSSYGDKGGRFWMRVGKSWHKPILQKKEVKDWVGMCGSSSRKNVVSLNQTFLLHFWKRLRIWGWGIPPTPRQWSPHSSLVALEGLFVGAWGRKGQWESYCLYFGTTFMLVTWDFLIVLSLRNPIFTSWDLAPSFLSK